jgi:hypothetical protein
MHLSMAKCFGKRLLQSIDSKDSLHSSSGITLRTELSQIDYLDKMEESSESSPLEEANEILIEIETEEAFEKSIADLLTLEGTGLKTC